MYRVEANTLATSTLLSSSLLLLVICCTSHLVDPVFHVCSDPGSLSASSAIRSVCTAEVDGFHRAISHYVGFAVLCNVFRIAIVKTAPYHPATSRQRQRQTRVDTQIHTETQTHADARKRARQHKSQTWCP